MLEVEDHLGPGAQLGPEVENSRIYDYKVEKPNRFQTYRSVEFNFLKDSYLHVRAMK
jgi:hypothetical protein